MTTPSMPLPPASEIKQAVRRHYARAAGAALSEKDPGQPAEKAASCCTPTISPGRSSCGTGSVRLQEGSGGGEQEGRVARGDQRLLDLGCGDPLSFAALQPAETVVDLGSGSGAEVLKAARIVGPRGRAIGVDMTPEMLELARDNLRVSGLTNVEFLEGTIESLPLQDASADVIVSNCVLNLSPDKESAFAEAFRVLRPGGRLVVADVVVAGGDRPEAAATPQLEAWTSCIAGAMTEAEYVRGLEGAGFVQIELHRIAGDDGEACCGADFTSLASDLISARKPAP